MDDSPLPPTLSAALRPVLPALAQEMVVAIGHEVPDYARPLEGPFGRALRLGVEAALARFVDQLADPGTDPHDTRGTYLQLGRGERRAGRSLDALLSAYRLGARLAWTRFQEAAADAGHPPEVVYALAGAIFSYIDAISAESAEGYAEEQSRAEGERGRRRRALVRALAGGEATRDELVELAAAAGWTLPSLLAALLLPAGEEHERRAARVDPEALVAVEGDAVLAWLPDPSGPGRRTQLEATLDGQPAVLGPAVPPGRAAESYARALAARDALAGPVARRAGAAAAAGATPASRAGPVETAPTRHGGTMPASRAGPVETAPTRHGATAPAPPSKDAAAGLGGPHTDTGGLVVADEHLLTLLLLAPAQRAVLTDLVATLLAPLDAAPPGQRDKLAATLRAWLDHPGQVQRVAGELSVHPQTVRYRVAGLRERLGDRLDDPDARFALSLALRGRALLDH